MYQLQLTTSQVGLRDILDHGGAASSLSASSPLPDFSPRPHWGLVPGRAERHLAKPQKHFQLQTAWCSPRRESRPKVEELTKSYHITIYISLDFVFTLLAAPCSCCICKVFTLRSPTFTLSKCLPRATIKVSHLVEGKTNQSRETVKLGSSK